MNDGTTIAPSSRDPLPALRFLTRLVQRNPDAERFMESILRGRLLELSIPALDLTVESGDPLGMVLARVMEEEGDPWLQAEVLKRLEGPPYLNSLPLSELAVVVTRTALERLDTDEELEGGVRDREIARLHHDLGERLFAVGALTVAVDHTRAAIRWREERRNAGDESILPELASSWIQLSSLESVAEHRQQAVEASHRGVDLLRQLAERSAGYRPALAHGLFHLARDLGNLRRLDEALAAAEKSMHLYRSVVDDSAPRQADLARSLNNWSSALREAGRHREALTAAEEVVEILKPLAAEEWDLYEPQLTMAYYNLGNRLGRLGRAEEAFEATRRAVEIRRRLVAYRPRVFSVELADSLLTLGTRLERLGRSEEALEAVQAAADLFEELATDDERHLPRLSAAIGNLGNRLRSNHRYGEALEAAERSVDLRRRLVRAQPQVFRHELAEGLANLGAKLGSLGRYEQALEASREAVKLYRKLEAKSPVAIAEEMVIALTGLRHHLVALRQDRAARDVAEEIVSRYRSLVDGGASHLVPRLASALTHLSDRLGDLGEFEASSEAAEESIELFRALALADDSAEVQEGLAAALRAAVRGMVASGRADRASRLAAESVAILERGAPSLDMDQDLADSLLNLGVCYAELGDFSLAVATTGRALKIREGLFAALPSRHGRGLAEAHFNLGAQWLQAQEPEEALAHLDRAIAHYGTLTVGHQRAFRGQVAQARSLRAVVSLQLGRLQEAMGEADQALDLQREVVRQEPTDADRLGYVQVLMQWLLVASEADPGQSLVSVSTEALRVGRELAECSALHRPLLARSLHNHGSVLHREGRGDESLECYRQALEMYRGLADSHPGWAPLLALAARDLSIVLADEGCLEDALAVSAEALRWVDSLDLSALVPEWITRLREEHEEYQRKLQTTRRT